MAADLQCHERTLPGARRASRRRWRALAAAGTATLLLAAAARAADPNVGPPKPLLPHSGSSRTFIDGTHAATATAAAKRPVAAVRTVPVEAKPLIPPANLPPRLGPPPQPRLALPLETDLQPLSPASQTPPADSAPAPAAKSPSG